MSDSNQLTPRSGQDLGDSALGRRLREMPPVKPSIDGWTAIAAELDAPPSGRSRWRWIAVAAAVLLAVLWLPHPANETPQDPPERLAEQADESPTERWIAYSQQLEQRLQTVRETPTSYRGGHAAVIGALEAQVAGVDWQLGLPLNNLEQRELWQQRTGLLREMVAIEAANRLAANGLNGVGNGSLGSLNSDNTRGFGDSRSNVSLRPAAYQL